MFVIKRDGKKEEVHFDKITARIKKLCYGLDKRYIDPVAVAMKVVQGIYSGVTTRELDQLAAETCAYSSTYHPDWSILAARIAVSDLHKQTITCFSKNSAKLHGHTHPKTGLPAPLIADDVFDIIQQNAERFDAAIDYTRDFDFDYFGFKTLERSYLLRMNDCVAERPQQMFMRVSIGIHKENIDAALETYHLMSQRYFTHATPTLFNGGTPRPQLSSCFLLTMKDDSIDGIYETLKQCACISKYAGGIGLSIHNIRATNSYIRGTNGTSNGIVPMLRVFSDTARYVDQGGGKRKGSFAIYLEPWHADIFDFLELKKNSGKEEMRARDLFYALWIPDLFMERVEANGNWSLFCPNEAPRLADTVGADFKALYEGYEAEGRARKTVRAQELWFAVLQAQMETGTPFMLYKDACNLKSNQQNLGVIKSSNLCTEILEFTAPDEVAVCNLASIALNMFVSKDESGTPTFEFGKLMDIAKVVTKNLNKVIDVNFYPIPEARNSNMRHRPIGLGVQGMADAFALMRLPFESDGAVELNKEIFETIYYGALWASTELAETDGHYESYPGSPLSKGQLQPDLWGVTPGPRWDWAALRERVAKFGARNSLLLAPMPTASTAQILGNNESIEPFTSNIYTRRVLAGEFPMVNRHLLKDLIARGLWTPQMRIMIIADKGSVQRIPTIPDDLRDLYKTVWEIKQRTMIDMAADRGAYICQSQSLNLFIADPTISKLTSMHFYGWKKGLKTGMYYLRTKPKADAIQFTVDQVALAESHNEAGIMAGFAAQAAKDLLVANELLAAAAAAPGGSPGKAAAAEDEDAISRVRVDSVDSSVTGGSDSEDTGPSSSLSPGGGEASFLVVAPTPVKTAAPAGGDEEAPISAAGGSPGEAGAGEGKAAQRAAHKAEMAALRDRLRASKDGYEDEGICLNCSA